MTNFQQLFSLGQQVQARLSQLQTELGNRTVNCSSGGGMVNVTVDGRGKIRAIKLDPSVVDPNDVEMLEDLVLAFHATLPGGVIICDDYLKGVRGGDLTLGSPKLAVDAFTTIYRDRIDIPWGQPLYQLAMVKIADRAGDDPGARGL